MVLAETDSTIAEAARRDVAGWVLAGFQTAGRGRRGRAWISPRGNFHGTLLIHPPGGAAQAALRSFVAALALHEALGRLTGLPQAFALKWPNDVLLNGGKVSGILLESLGTSGAVDRLAIGIGVNLIAAPAPEQVEPGAVPPVSVLAETGLRLSPEVLLDALAPAFARWEARLASEGFAPIREAWLARAARLGEPVTARTGRMTLNGIFDTIDSTGAIVLRTTKGIEILPAADIFF